MSGLSVHLGEAKAERTLPASKPTDGLKRLYQFLVSSGSGNTPQLDNAFFEKTPSEDIGEGWCFIPDSSSPSLATHFDSPQQDIPPMQKEALTTPEAALPQPEANESHDELLVKDSHPNLYRIYTALNQLKQEASDNNYRGKTLFAKLQAIADPDLQKLQADAFRRQMSFKIYPDKFVGCQHALKLANVAYRTFIELCEKTDESVQEGGLSNIELSADEIAEIYRDAIKPKDATQITVQTRSLIQQESIQTALTLDDLKQNTRVKRLMEKGFIKLEDINSANLDFLQELISTSDKENKHWEQVKHCVSGVMTQYQIAIISQTDPNINHDYERYYTQETHFFIHLCVSHNKPVLLAQALEQEPDGANGCEVTITERNSLYINEYTPLMRAVSLNNLECVGILLKAGADVHFRSCSRKFQHVVYCCTKQGAIHLVRSTAILQTLLEYDVDVNMVNEKGETLLHIVASSTTGADQTIRLEQQIDDDDFIETLIQAGAKVNSLDKNKNTPLHLACASGKTGLLLSLLMAARSTNSNDEIDRKLHCTSLSSIKDRLPNIPEITQANSNGLNPVMLAVAKGELDTIKLLFAAGIDPVILDERGFNFIQVLLFELLDQEEQDKSYNKKKYHAQKEHEKKLFIILNWAWEKVLKFDKDALEQIIKQMLSNPSVYLMLALTMDDSKARLAAIFKTLTTKVTHRCLEAAPRDSAATSDESAATSGESVATPKVSSELVPVRSKTSDDDSLINTGLLEELEKFMELSKECHLIKDFAETNQEKSQWHDWLKACSECGREPEPQQATTVRSDKTSAVALVPKLGGLSDLTKEVDTTAATKMLDKLSGNTRLFAKFRRSSGLQRQVQDIRKSFSDKEIIQWAKYFETAKLEKPSAKQKVS